MSDTTEMELILRGSIAAQDERERLAGEKCGVDWEMHGCDWPDAVAERVLWLRSEVDRLAERNAKLEAFRLRVENGFLFTGATLDARIGNCMNAAIALGDGRKPDHSADANKMVGGER